MTKLTKLGIRKITEYFIERDSAGKDGLATEIQQLAATALMPNLAMITTAPGEKNTFLGTEHLQAQRLATMNLMLYQAGVYTEEQQEAALELLNAAQGALTERMAALQDELDRPYPTTKPEILHPYQKLLEAYGNQAIAIGRLREIFHGTRPRPAQPPPK